MSSGAATKVIIVGCGIAGPVLATLLKHDGYNPVVYERITRHSDEGLSLMLQDNGLRVLGLIGVLEQIQGQAEERVALYSTVPGHEDVLGDCSLDDPSIPGDVNIGVGVRRHDFLDLLAETALDAGVQIHWDHKVRDVVQSESSDSVQVVFENGETDEASFVIGCDGIHSDTRISLFGKEEARYTGLTQMGGFSPTPQAFTAQNSVVSFFGENAHMISYKVGPGENSWAITRREPEHRETWRAVDDTVLAELKEDPVSQWPFGAGELVKTADKIIKYGLYDRPELATWYKGRVVLLGDAAHPTSPHLGQGANQALEDIYHLVNALVEYSNPSAKNPSTETLTNAFKEYESIRLHHTSMLVKKARDRGEARVVRGIDACLARNEEVREAWKDPSVALRSETRGLL